MSHLIVIFVVGYLTVFAHGFQSRNVNHGNYGWAAATSMLIAVGNVSVWNYLAVSATIAEVATYGLSGACAITSSMWIHERFVKRHSEKMPVPLRPSPEKDTMV